MFNPDPTRVETGLGPPKQTIEGESNEGVLEPDKTMFKTRAGTYRRERINSE